MMRPVIYTISVFLMTHLIALSIVNAEPIDKPLKVGFLYISPISDAGWSYAHDLGRRAIEKMPGVTAKFVESVDEGMQSEPILEFMAQKKYDLIFATSYGYMDHVIKIAKLYPDVTIMHCAGYKRAENVGTYFGRIYQARYLTGIVAGAMTTSDRIGYVAAYPIPEVIRGINAFALGARRINPKALIEVIWTYTWHDPVKEKTAGLSLLNGGVDVITQHQDTPAVQVAAQDKGAYSIGYNTDMRKFAPRAHLTAPVWRWEIIYRHIVQQVQSGTWQSQDIWWGLDKGAVDIAPLSPLVPDPVKNKVRMAKRELIQKNRHVFQGPIADQNGKIRISAGTKAKDNELLNMKWFVKGVIGGIK